VLTMMNILVLHANALLIL